MVGKLFFLFIYVGPFVAVALLIAASVAVRRRRLALLTTGMVMLLFWFSIVLPTWSANRNEVADAARIQQIREQGRGRIPPSEVEPLNMRLVPVNERGEPVAESGGRFSQQVLAGRVRNRSARYNLFQIRINLILRRCRSADDCDTLHTSPVLITSDVPPNAEENIYAGLPGDQTTEERTRVLAAYSGSSFRLDCQVLETWGREARP